MTGVSNLETILRRLKQEQEDRLEFESEKPVRKERFERDYQHLVNLIIGSLDIFTANGLLKTSVQNIAYSNTDFGSYMAETLTIQAGDKTITLSPKDGLNAALTLHPPAGKKSTAALLLVGTNVQSRRWAYKTSDFLGAVAQPSSVQDNLTFVTEVSARFLIEQILSAQAR